MNQLSSDFHEILQTLLSSHLATTFFAKYQRVAYVKRPFEMQRNSEKKRNEVNDRIIQYTSCCQMVLLLRYKLYFYET